MNANRELPNREIPIAVERAYALWVWLDARVADFPAHARRALGERLLGESIDLVADLSSAAYAPRGSPRRAERLVAASERVALLRLLVRGAFERRYVAGGQHEHAMRLLVEIGRMVGAWRKHARGEHDAA